MASLPTALSLQPVRFLSFSHKVTIHETKLWKSRHIWFGVHLNFDKLKRDIVFRAGNTSDSLDSNKNEIEATRDIVKLEKNHLNETVHILPPPSLTMIKTSLCSKFAIAIYIAITASVIIARKIITIGRNNQFNNQGSISDLVRRGQLKSNRRGNAKTGLYNDPFDNPFVKMNEDNSTVQMFGKVFKLTPTNLTKEKQLTHQERRSRAYQWKRPKVFLKEGEPVPKDVDPETVRWIPPNHPFASNCSEFSEERIKSNVFQRDGVPFRVRAEHEALHKKLDALQDEPKMKELATNLKNFEETKQVEPNEEKKQGDRMGKNVNSSDEKS